MWNGPLHDQAFVEKLLLHVDNNSDRYGTYARMKGMLTVAKEVCGFLAYLLDAFFERKLQELNDALFYFVPGKVAGHFHCETPSLDEVAYVTPREASQFIHLIYII